MQFIVSEDEATRCWIGELCPKIWILISKSGKKCVFLRFRTPSPDLTGQ